MLKRTALTLAIAFIVSLPMFAQVTTSNITGTVKSASGEYLTGATVTATHIPSGTIYTTIAKKDGAFALPGLRVGGPYTVRIDFVGQKSQVLENIILQLGESYNINAALGTDEKELTGVLVTGRGRKAATDRGGMSTVVNNRQISSLPTITRSITDFTRSAPQANGTSFGGRDGRYNNLTVDGANLNNNFGLSTDPLPGGGNSPVSLDAIEEVSVSLVPFDVRQGNFTGGLIAAITKSGTNTFHGTVYGYRQNQDMIGYKIKDANATKNPFKSSVYGASVGGPIIKNKLFFFLNYEKEIKPPTGGITWTPKGGSGTGNVSDVPVDSLKKVSTYLNSLGFDPGVYDNFPNFKNENRKFLVKIDWNISKVHKLTLKYSDFLGNQDNLPSQSGSIGGTYSGATYGPKFSKSAMGFSNITYLAKDIVKSGALELNSNFNGRFSNQFLATITKIESDKTHNGDKFPFIDILGGTTGDIRNFISAGNEPFNGNNNVVINDIYTITDNFTYYAGKHTLTAGASYEYQHVGNEFMRGSQGYYVFKNVDDFVNNRAPLKYAITYSFDKGKEEVFSADLKIGQLAAYLQDEINVNQNLKISIGLRMDKPIYLEQPRENPQNTLLTFADLEGNATRYNTGAWPKATPLWSPRIGFRWDMEGDKSFILRGGTGIFTGRIPFVYLTNIPTNSGMYQFSSSIAVGSAGINMNNYLFNKDPHAYNPAFNSNLPANYFPTVAGTAASTDFVVVQKDYKFPQVWRTNIGFDKQVARTWRFSADVMYTKDINATYMYNANLPKPTATVTTGSVTRGYYATTAARKINASIINAIVLDNTKKGHSFVFTAQIAKSFTNGFSASLAYNYTFAQDVTANPGSQASSVWTGNQSAGTPNDFALAYSNFATPHRVVGAISYRKEYLKHLGTTISVFYDGKNDGLYTYVYSGDLNNDGITTSDLMYVPMDAKNGSEIQFKNNVTYTNGVTYTSAEQAAIFQNYIDQDPYLRKHKGQVVERNGGKYPWYNRVDAKVVQDIFTNIGRQRHTLQISADIFNVANLLNKDWGIRKFYTVNNPLKLESVTNGIPLFSITSYNGAPVTRTFVDNVSTSTTWAMQLGIRYIF